MSLQDSFFLRRLHSLSGIVPVGLFLCFHLFANSVSLVGAENYDLIIEILRSLPFVEAIEILVLGVPIAFHALYGIVIYTTAKPNHWQYSHSENWRYYLQRITGVIALFFIIYHVWQFRFVEDLDYNYIAKTMASSQTLSILDFSIPISIYWLYIIGIVSIVYHFANGIWGFCITWGITIGKKSQMITAVFSLGVFFVLSYIGVITANHLADAGALL